MSLPVPPLAIPKKWTILRNVITCPSLENFNNLVKLVGNEITNCCQFGYLVYSQQIKGNVWLLNN